MITRAEVQRLARDGLVDERTQERDYVLTWLLAAMAVQDFSLVFKGGTCLRRCYIPGYRYSEDLDFSLPPGSSPVVELVQGRWRPDPPPTWIAAVPSLRHPNLVGDFARRLAAALGLPYHDVLAAADAPQQKSLQNSVGQLRNVATSLRVIAECPPGPVLLLDDIVDSRWTMTLAGWLLQHHGSGRVHPFALATATPQDDG
ncbi:MAG: nucleotidyl transferase AbiEii/AbiGii toxin family protein [Chloroflexota bacterium]